MEKKFIQLYRIWSVEHDRWWNAGGVGYVYNQKEAGIFPYEEAAEIVARANLGIERDGVPNEILIPINRRFYR